MNGFETALVLMTFFIFGGACVLYFVWVGSREEDEPLVEIMHNGRRILVEKSFYDHHLQSKVAGVEEYPSSIASERPMKPTAVKLVKQNFGTNLPDEAPVIVRRTPKSSKRHGTHRVPNVVKTSSKVEA